MTPPLHVPLLWQLGNVASWARNQRVHPSAQPNLMLDGGIPTQADETRLYCWYPRPPRTCLSGNFLPHTVRFYGELLRAQALINELAYADTELLDVLNRLEQRARVSGRVGLRHAILDLSLRNVMHFRTIDEGVARVEKAGRRPAGVEFLAYLVHNPSYMIALAQREVPGVVLGGLIQRGRCGSPARAPIVHSVHSPNGPQLTLAMRPVNCVIKHWQLPTVRVSH